MSREKLETDKEYAPLTELKDTKYWKQTANAGCVGCYVGCPAKLKGTA